ncbi:MAG: hypothetical protein ACPGKY_03100, partial [Nitrosopumilus sp.]
MEKLTVLETIDKIEKLIDENSGDIGRLEHIVDFLKKEKPLYNTDRIYLESKINAEIIFEEKIIKKESESEQIKKLTKSGKGDPGRLEHIQIMLKKNKNLYESDKQYLESNFGIKIVQKQKEEIKIEQIEQIENRGKGAMPKGWKPVDSEQKLDKITDKIKEEKEEIIEQKKDLKIDEQKNKLNKLIE